MRARRPSTLGAGISCIVFGCATLFGCNALTGIGDYDFNRIGDPNDTDTGVPDDGSPTSDSGTDSSAPVCPEGASVEPASKNPKCLPCLLDKCCDSLKACAADTPCNGERKCFKACNGDRACIVNCRNDFACGLVTDLSVNSCISRMCSAECLDAVSPTPDAGDGAVACAPFVGPCVTARPQCGCMSGENCVFKPGFGGETKCVPAGATADDSACTDDAQCLAGSACVYGACKPFCNSDSANQCGTDRSTCLLAFRDSKECTASLPIFGDAFCGSKCDPLNPSAVCGAGLSCEALSDYTDCRGPVGSATGPSNCLNGTPAEKCAPGYECLTYTHTDKSGASHDVSTCEPWCAVSAGGCPGSRLCTAFNNAPKIGTTTYGTCSANCDLANASSCPAGSACFNFADGNNIAYTTCLPSTGTGMGINACQTTQTSYECAPGRTCIHGAGTMASTYYCVQWCKIGGTDCTGSEKCMTFTNAPTIKGVQYGYCG